jgi:DedD protein
VYDIPARGERLSVQIPAAAQKDTAQKDAAASAPAHAAATLAPASSADTPAQIRARRRAALAENEELLDEAPLAAGSDEPAPNAAQAAAAKALADKAQAAADKLARDKAAKAQQAKQEQSAQDLADKADKAKADKLAKAEKEKTEKAKADKAKADEATRARALLEGKTEAKSDPKAEAKSDPKAEAKTDPKADAKTTHERSVVQFGSFSDSAKAAEVRHKVEATGLKTYTQEIDTPRGKLIRLRVGPFNKAEDADAAAKKIKALGLPAAILTL